jgi:hypothetical protein
MLSKVWRGALRLLLLGLTFAAPVSLAVVDRYPLVVVAVWLATAVVITAAARELWPQLHIAAGVACVLVGGTLAWAAALLGFLATLGVAISSSLCGDQTPVQYWLPVLTVYAAGGSWALAGRPRRALLGWPATVLLAAAVGLAFFASVPGAHGYCET